MAIKKIHDIPLVFSVVADPVLAGAGKSFEYHLPHVTGISTMGDYAGMATVQCGIQIPEDFYNRDHVIVVDDSRDSTQR